MDLFKGIGPAISYNGPKKVVAPVDPNCEAQGLVPYSESKVVHGLRGIEKKTVVRCVSEEESAKLLAAKQSRFSPVSTPQGSPMASPVASPASNGSAPMSFKERMAAFQKGGLDMTAWSASLAAQRRAAAMPPRQNARVPTISTVTNSVNSPPTRSVANLRKLFGAKGGSKKNKNKTKKNKKNKTKKNKNKKRN